MPWPTPPLHTKIGFPSLILDRTMNYMRMSRKAIAPELFYACRVLKGRANFQKHQRQGSSEQ